MPIKGLSKDWYKSKLIWLGVVTSAMSILELVRLFLEQGDFSVEAVAGLIVGSLIVVFRKYFTSTSIR